MYRIEVLGENDTWVEYTVVSIEDLKSTIDGARKLHPEYKFRSVKIS